MIFIATNTDSAQFTALWWNLDAPLWLMLAVVTLIGFVVGWFVGRRSRR
ncbi:LapA family protein [Gordonia sp. PDNC005]|nr:LapA family protein [Gordonia sp. PDNC005]QRY64038.1 LapA family protein [Gordonia sp. PDNC005]